MQRFDKPQAQDPGATGDQGVLSGDMGYPPTSPVHSQPSPMADFDAVDAEEVQQGGAMTGVTVVRKGLTVCS